MLHRAATELSPALVKLGEELISLGPELLLLLLISHFPAVYTCNNPQVCSSASISLSGLLSHQLQAPLTLHVAPEVVFRWRQSAVPWQFTVRACFERLFVLWQRKYWRMKHSSVCSCAVECSALTQSGTRADLLCAASSVSLPAVHQHVTGH